MIAQTSGVEVFTDGVAFINPARLGTDFRDLFVQPIMDIGRVTRVVKVEDVVSVPWTEEGIQDVAVAVGLGVDTIIIRFGSGTSDYLDSSQQSKKGGGINHSDRLPTSAI